MASDLRSTTEKRRKRKARWQGEGECEKGRRSDRQSEDVGGSGGRGNVMEEEGESGARKKGMRRRERQGEREGGGMEGVRESGTAGSYGGILRNFCLDTLLACQGTHPRAYTPHRPTRMYESQPALTRASGGARSRSSEACPPPADSDSATLPARPPPQRESRGVHTSVTMGGAAGSKALRAVRVVAVAGGVAGVDGAAAARRTASSRSGDGTSASADTASAWAGLTCACILIVAKSHFCGLGGLGKDGGMWGRWGDGGVGVGVGGVGRGSQYG